MPEILLSQSEADRLLATEKQAALGEKPLFPDPGAGKIKVEVELRSNDNKESFLLDVSRSRMKISKATYQHRVRQVIILARVDLDGPPHRNPDGVEMPCPHLHVYREGFGAKWAGPLPPNFSNPNDLWQTFEDFCDFCNIIGPTPIERGLLA
ncbi:MAG: hypothetical protein EA381_00600 [Planctomycetaceae bacterium]|nr:MAG: hypothetical protein EA381_00600 [Planctomycetaceae bacterium]